MIVHVILIIILLAAGARSAFQGWNSYRRHRVKASIFLDNTITREAQPPIYWSAMVFHAVLVIVFFGSAAALAIGMLRHAN